MSSSNRLKPERREIIGSDRSARGRGRLERASDRALHAWLKRVAPRGDGIEVGIGDDCAVVRLGGARMALKVDPTIEGVHFDRGLRDAAAVARKAIGRPASDFAAAGAEPRFALLSVDLPRGATAAFARALLAALLRESRRVGARVVGGHTGVGTGGLAVGVTLVGPCPRPRRRSGARAGDRCLATGAFGGSILGRHLRPAPRLREERALARAVPIHAAIDVSDGLALDAFRLADASGLGLELREDSIPISRDAVRLARKSGRAPLSHALGDGEDYELLLAVASRDVARALAVARRSRFPLAEIGTFRRERGLRLLGRDGRVSNLEPTGFTHFA